MAPLVQPGLAMLLAGEPLEFAAPPRDRTESPKEMVARTIPAKWLEELAAKPARTVNVPLVISNAIVKGPLDLQYVRFAFEVSITGTTFVDEGDFSFAVFERTANFESSRFERPVVFRACRAEADFDIEGAIFANDSSFQDLHVKEVLSATGARFGAVNFERIEINKDASFSSDDRGNHVEFGGETSFLAAHVASNLEFSGARFRAATTFDGMRVDGDAFFDSDDKQRRVTFDADATFTGIRVEGNLDCRGAEFRAKAVFDGSQVGGDAVFRGDDWGQGVGFGGEASFIGMHIQDNADFSQATFMAGVSFDGVRIDGDAIFSGDDEKERVTFGDGVTFVGAQIQGNADFSGAGFKAMAAFDGMDVSGDAIFRNDSENRNVNFEGEVTFVGAHFRGNADFYGANFKLEANFDSIVVDGDAIFQGDHGGQLVTFEKAAEFSSAIFNSDTQFANAEFKEDVDFENAHFCGGADFSSVEFGSGNKAIFIGSRFDYGASFEDAIFENGADFTASVAARKISFSGAEFSGPVNLCDASFQVVHFGQEQSDDHGTHPRLLLRSTKFKSSLDLLGFTYERLYVNLEQLLPRIKSADRQPYTQLEAALHKVGDDVGAWQVYLERRRVERNRMFSERRYSRWVIDWIYKAVANYGIRPYRLLTYASFFVLLGTLLFTQPGALELKDDKKAAPAPTSICVSDPNFVAALGVSVHEFLPIDVPVGSKWVPASRKISIPLHFAKRTVLVPVWPSVYATIFLRLTGAVLVGIGLGSITGLLRRVTM